METRNPLFEPYVYKTQTWPGDPYSEQAQARAENDALESIGAVLARRLLEVGMPCVAGITKQTVNDYNSGVQHCWYRLEFKAPEVKVAMPKLKPETGRPGGRTKQKEAKRT